MKKGLSQLAETLEGSLRTRSDSAPSHGANESEAPGSSCRNAPGAIRRRRTARMKAKPPVPRVGTHPERFGAVARRE
jgi:hypothetical protein